MLWHNLAHSNSIFDLKKANFPISPNKKTTAYVARANLHTDVHLMFGSEYHLPKLI